MSARRQKQKTAPQRHMRLFACVPAAANRGLPNTDAPLTFGYVAARDFAPNHGNARLYFQPHSPHSTQTYRGVITSIFV
jgi:hypothetical protein